MVYKLISGLSIAPGKAATANDESVATSCAGVRVGKGVILMSSVDARCPERT